ncbi:unnamed protein product [Urochloa humidicola]
MEPLPIDLQLEIVAHSDDAATIVRCAAASKPLRAAVHGPGFRPRSQAALLAATYAGFDPALLLGISHPLSNRSASAAADHLQSPLFEPVSSRDELLVLWRRDPEPELRVCNTSTGDVTPLPCMDVEGKWGNGGIYRPALLNIGRRCSSFELLVMDVCFRTRIFSSRSGSWGAIRVVKPPPEHDSWCAIDEAMRTSPAVIRRTVYWICRSTRNPAAGVFVLALHVGAAQATAIAPPLQGCGVGSTASCVSLTEVGNRLGMVVSGTEVISIWRLSTEGWWSQEVVIRKQAIAPGMDVKWMDSWCVGFRREKGGTMLLWMERVGLVQIHLGTKEATVLCSRSSRHDHTTAVATVRLGDIDLASLF